MPGINTRKIIQNLFLIIGLAALVVMVYKLGLITIIENIRKTGWYIFLTIGLWAVAYLLNTVSEMVIIRDGSPESKNVKFPTLFKITLTAFAINTATPVGLVGGEPYKIMELKPYLGITKATSSVILFTMMHIVSHLLFWAFCIFLAATTISLNGDWTKILIVVFFLCLFCIFLFFKGYRKGMTMNILLSLGKIPFLKKKMNTFIDKEKEKLKLIDEQITSLHGKNKIRFYTSLGLEFFGRILTCAEIYFLFIAFGQPISYWHCILIVGFTSLFANILFFSPMQLGTKEGGFLLIFGLLGLSSVWAVSISFITRIRELFWLLIGISLMKIQINDGSKVED